MRPGLAVLILWLALAGCAPRPAISVQPQATETGTVLPVFVGTTRAPDATRLFGPRRDSRLRFARVDVSVPPEHAPGRLEMAHPDSADPERHFVAAGLDLHAGEQRFTRDLSAALRDLPSGRREAMIFVHGFNNTFADSVFRAAQIAHDFALPGVMVTYSWPAAGDPLGYAHDRDSALFARDGLVELIEAVNRAGADEVILVGHSLGAQLGMEAMRQIALQRPGQVRRLVDSVVLISPDIDVTLFRMQARRIGTLPDPFVIFASDRDRALRLSARLTGERDRLGNVSDIDRVADLDVVVFDVSAFGGTGPLNHTTAISSPTLIGLFRDVGAVRDAFQRDKAGRTGLWPGTVLTVQNATEIILSPAGTAMAN